MPPGHLQTLAELKFKVGGFDYKRYAFIRWRRCGKCRDRVGNYLCAICLNLEKRREKFRIKIRSASERIER